MLRTSGKLEKKIQFSFFKYLKLNAYVLSLDLKRNRYVPRGVFLKTASAADRVISPANLDFHIKGLKIKYVSGHTQEYLMKK